jgi:tetratricopeptide (TPR) repeat protein
MMHSRQFSRLSLAGALFALALSLGCAKRSEPPPAEQAKMPISTSSDEARELYLEGRQLVERLRATEARTLFKQAIELDDNFAIAHLALANTSTTARDFFDSIEAAVERAHLVSQAEQHMIYAQDAGTRSDPAAQRKHLTALVAAFPQDERAHSQLGGFYFGRQDFREAIKHFQHAIEIDPDFSPPYNLMGYSYRSLRNFDAAEKALKRYTELIPDEPNPYDSYGELLMKVGRFEESIEKYKKALEINPKFVFSYAGIANNLMFLGRFEKARWTLRELYEDARNSADRRTALFWAAASYVHQGNTKKALKECWLRYTVAKEDGDPAGMAGDLAIMGDILLESGSPEEALSKYEKAIEVINGADLKPEVKAAASRNFTYKQARVALAQGRLQDARTAIESYRSAAEMKQIPAELRQIHELDGLLATAENDFESALSFFLRANQQNPRILYYAAKAAYSAGRTDQGRDLADRAANFNGLNFNYAYVRTKAQKLANEAS